MILFHSISGCSGIQFDNITVKPASDFHALLRMVEKSRSWSCCVIDCCTILESLLRIFQPEISSHQFPCLQILKELSYLHFEATDFPKSIQYAKQFLMLAEELDDQNFQADADYILSRNYAYQNAFETAVFHIDAYEKRCRDTDDVLCKARILWTRSIIARERHEDETALQYAEKFLATAKTLDDEILEMEALNNLAVVHIRLFNVEKSVRLSDECFQLAKKNNHFKMEMESKFRKAFVYLVLGEHERAYNMFMKYLSSVQTGHRDKYVECLMLNNISYLALNVSQKYDGNKAYILKENALEHTQKTLSIAECIKSRKLISLAHLNRGLVFMECYEDYDNAVKHFHEGLKIATELNSARLIRNGNCCLGRLHEARGERQLARECFTRALETDDPPCTHWGEGENLRFSPDYLLALQYIGGRQWKDAAKFLHAVIQRCKRQRKSVKDSLLKIPFNEKLAKPYQYLQYVHLEDKAIKDALFIGEEGRARDFYDNLVDRNENVAESAPNPEELLGISKVQNTAVLFISQLTVVSRVYCWFIGTDGRIKDVFFVSHEDWIPLHTKLCVTMHELAAQWENSETSVEYRGVEMLKDGSKVSSSIFIESISEQTESLVEKRIQTSDSDQIPSSCDHSDPFLPEEGYQSTIATDESIPRSNDVPVRKQPLVSSKTTKRKVSKNPMEEMSQVIDKIR